MCELHRRPLHAFTNTKEVLNLVGFCQDFSSDSHIRIHTLFFLIDNSRNCKTSCSFHEHCKVCVFLFVFPFPLLMLRSTFHYRRQTAPNIILFGATGAGKSSVVNMLPGGSHEATVSSSAKGVTFKHERYEKDIGDHRINVFDTVGLGEGKSGTVPAAKTIELLYRLMCGLKDGINLLVYVVRGPRLSSSIRKNYELFYDIFCQKKVPIVVVITGLENEEDMDGWWEENQMAYSEENMTFAGAACITAIKGRRNMFAPEFGESQEKVERLILDHGFKTTWLPPPPLGGTSWLVTCIVNCFNKLAKFFNFRQLVFSPFLYKSLRNLGDMGDEDAILVANKIHNDVLQTPA